MFTIDKEGTAYLNSAIVPRYKNNIEGDLLVNFSWVEFVDNKLSHISNKISTFFHASHAAWECQNQFSMTPSQRECKLFIFGLAVKDVCTFLATSVPGIF